MEQATAHYWMLMKKKQHILNNNKSLHLQARSDSSWEERAFAEDAAGTLGGPIMWPPRSYSCSFCKREFRSAQALGGHMNVHRRDRARLKQSLSPHDHNSSTANALVASSSSTSPLSPPRVSALALSSTTHENPSDTYHHLHAFVSSSSSSRRGHDDDIETDLSVGLNCSRAGDDQSMIMGCKRAKLAVSSSSSSSLLFSLKPCFQAAEMIGFKASSMEDLDLELRLGHDPPQVN